MGLLVAGIDLRCTPEGQWFCFEVNPSPAFTYYQAVTHQPVDEAIAQLLVDGPTGQPQKRLTVDGMMGAMGRSHADFGWERR
jgi:hypothetical protein